MFLMQHNDSNYRKKSAFPPYVTLHDETKVTVHLGFLYTRDGHLILLGGHFEKAALT